MTPDCKVTVVEDVFVTNDVCVLPREQYSSAGPIAGAAWMSHLVGRSGHSPALEQAVETVLRAARFQLMLLCAHTVAQPDGAVSRHRRLWKSLEGSGVRLPPGARTDEYVVPDGDGLRWFGAIAIEPGDVDSVWPVVHAEPASMLIAAPVEALGEAHEVLARGWRLTARGPPIGVLAWLASRDGVAFWPVGAFDDPESGVVAFCRPGRLELIKGVATLVPGLQPPA